MNRRLQELYLEATEQFKIVQEQGLPAPYQTRAFAAKFAELIVQECSNFLKDTLDDHFAAEQLEEHFGVEE